MLFRVIQTSQNQSYTWTFIDKSQEDKIYLLSMSKPAQPLNNAIRWKTKKIDTLCLSNVVHGHSSMAYVPTLMPSRRRPPPTSVVYYSRGHPIRKSLHHIIMFPFSPPIAYHIVPSLLNNPVKHSNTTHYAKGEPFQPRRR
ncbi:uncharacterized protein F5147DRAFT_678800 [Suillus discolor]|uniref:Uncharacterized protein n=1 Tax=Suillus discolor TaxID=1912936 RepID=A0A9P7FCM0_9AGAM|nr:uncharacterized protein F5147DRAFT_678800 [Suillus discolor]KAG2114278.1 hypothetical protein F5147DRAFT_678800 [Suillus discolor]